MIIEDKIKINFISSLSPPEVVSENISFVVIWDTSAPAGVVVDVVVVVAVVLNLMPKE